MDYLPADWLIGLFIYLFRNSQKWSNIPDQKTKKNWKCWNIYTRVSQWGDLHFGWGAYCSDLSDKITSAFPIKAGICQMPSFTCFHSPGDGISNWLCWWLTNYSFSLLALFYHVALSFNCLKFGVSEFFASLWSYIQSHPLSEGIDLTFHLLLPTSPLLWEDSHSTSWY